MLSKWLPPGQAVHLSSLPSGTVSSQSHLAFRDARAPPAPPFLPSRPVPAHGPAHLSPALHFLQKKDKWGGRRKGENMIIAVGKGRCYRLDNAGNGGSEKSFFPKITLFNLNSTLKRSLSTLFNTFCTQIPNSPVYPSNNRNNLFLSSCTFCYRNLFPLNYSLLSS